MPPEQLPVPASSVEFQTPSKSKYILGILRRFIQAMIGAYGLTVLGHLILRGLFGDEITIVALQTTFAHLTWIPALILLPICLLLRWWRPALFLVPAVLAFGLTYGGQFIPRTITVPDETPSFKMLTYNLLGNRRDYSESMEIIRESDADIVAMQELSVLAAEMIEETFVDDYPYRALHPRVGTQGQGVLSRFPIAEDEYWQNTWLPSYLGNQRLQFEFNGDWITLYNVHPTHPGMAGSFFNPTFRDQEIADIVERVQQENGMVILVGDFNMPDLTASHGQITAELTDAYRAAGYGLGLTFPASKAVSDYFYNVPNWVIVPPLIRLDYVFYSSGLMASEAHVLSQSGGSDHMPVQVTLALSN